MYGKICPPLPRGKDVYALVCDDCMLFVVVPHRAVTQFTLLLLSLFRFAHSNRYVVSTSTSSSLTVCANAVQW